MVYIAIVLCGLSAFVSLADIVGVWAAYRRQPMGIPGGYSSVPLISIALGVLAWLIARRSIGAWALLPAAIDPGTWQLIWLPFYLVWHRRRNRE